MTDDMQRWNPQDMEKQIDQLLSSGRETYRPSDLDQQFLHDLRLILASEEHDSQPQINEDTLKRGWARIAAANAFQSTIQRENTRSTHRRFIGMRTLPSMPDQSVARQKKFNRSLTTMAAAAVALIVLAGTLVIFTLARQPQPNTLVSTAKVPTQATPTRTNYVYHQPGEPIYGLIWSADGRRIISSNDRVDGWDAFSGANKITYVTPPKDTAYIVTPQLSPDRKTLAVLSVGALDLYDVASGKHRQTFTYPFSKTPGYKLSLPHFAPSIGWSSDGHLIRVLVQIPANQLLINKIVTYDVAKGTRQELTLKQTEQLGDIAWSPDGKLVAVGQPDSGIVSILDVTNGQVINSAHLGAPIETIPLNWSPDSRNVVADFGTGNGIAIWNAGKVKNVIFYQGGTYPTWSPNGKYIAVISGATVKILDASNGHVLKTYTSEKGSLYTLAWSPDSAFLAAGGASSSRNGVVNVWKLSL